MGNERRSRGERLSNIKSLKEETNKRKILRSFIADQKIQRLDAFEINKPGKNNWRFRSKLNFCLSSALGGQRQVSSMNRKDLLGLVI